MELKLVFFLVALATGFIFGEFQLYSEKVFRAAIRKSLGGIKVKSNLQRSIEFVAWLRITNLRRGDALARSICTY